MAALPTAGRCAKSDGEAIEPYAVDEIKRLLEFTQT